jgi:hypothetical protein
MFWTIIKDVYEELNKKGLSEEESLKKACYNSMDMKRNWSSEQIKKWNKKDGFWDCSGIQTLITDKQKVSYIDEHIREGKNEYYNVRAFFRLPKDKSTSYSKKDDKHTTAQHILAALILQREQIRIDYRDIPFYLDDIDLILKDKTAEHILEQSFIDRDIGINRRADLLFELETPNLTFGKGFVFEIINSEDMASIKEKSKDWAKVGYSLIAIPIENFDFDNFGLKKDNYLILHRLFDDLNLYLDLLKKIKDNEPLIDNFNKNVKEMERKIFLWRSGRHSYQILDNEKVSSLLLFCITKELRKFKGRQKLILTCSDYSNRLIDIDIWDNNSLFNEFLYKEMQNKLMKVEGGYFKEYLGDVSLVLNQFSKLKQIEINEENA